RGARCGRRIWAAARRRRRWRTRSSARSEKAQRHRDHRDSETPQLQPSVMLFLHPDELDGSLVARSRAFSCAGHLVAIDVQLTCVERDGSSWPRMRCEGDVVSLHDAIERMLVAFISLDRAGYRVAGLFE